MGAEGTHEAQLGAPTPLQTRPRKYPSAHYLWLKSVATHTDTPTQTAHTFAPTLSKARTLHPNTLAHTLSILNMPVHSDSYCTHEHRCTLPPVHLKKKKHEAFLRALHLTLTYTYKHMFLLLFHILSSNPPPDSRHSSLEDNKRLGWTRAHARTPLQGRRGGGGREAWARAR